MISDLLGIMLGAYCPRLLLLLFGLLLCVLFVVWLLSCGHCHVWFLLVVCCVFVFVFVDCCFVGVSVVVSVVTCVSKGYAFVFLVVIVLALLGSRT